MKPVQQLLKTTKIGDIVNSRLVQAPSEISVRAAVDLMRENKSGYVVVADHNHNVVGMFTETDVLNRVFGNDEAWKKPVSEYMTKKPIILSANDTIGRAVEIMGQNFFYHIPLVDEKGMLLNVLSVRSLIRYIGEFYPTEIYNLPPKHDQTIETAEGG